MIIVDGTGNTPLVKKVTEILETSVTKSKIQTFNDGEISVEMFENIRGQDAYIIHSLSYPVNDNLMKLMLIMDALQRASVSRINLVCPYLCYSRQDRKDKGRTPISARLIADMLEMKADRIMTFDLHAEQIQGFYTIPFDNLYASIVYKKFLKEELNIHPDSDSIIVSPDTGGAKRARTYGEYLDVPIAIVEKRRPRAGECEVMNVIGDVKDKHCIIVDDMIDTGGTMCNAAKVIKDMGAKSIKIMVTHGVLSKNAVEKLEESCFDQIYISNTIDNTEKLQNTTKFIVIDFAPLLAEAVKRLSEDQSISDLFD